MLTQVNVIPRSRTERRRIDLTKAVVLIIVAGYLVGSNQWEPRGFLSDLMFAAGVTLVGVATAGRIWWRPYIAGRKSRVLVTEGPYSMCRNPLYFFSFIGCAGVGLTTEMLLPPLAVLLTFAAYYPLVIAAEESRLRAAHGEAYAEYCRSTPRFIPRLKRLREAEEYCVHARHFRDGLIDATCFVWAVGLIELGEALHEAHILPSLLPMW